MKKVLAIVLSIMLLVTQSGLALTIHWCGGSVSGVEVFHPDKHKCRCGKKAMKASCCKDRTMVLKAKGTQQKATKLVLKVPVPKLEWVGQKVQVVKEPTVPVKTDFYRNFHPPPHKATVPIYLRNGTLTI